MQTLTYCCQVLHFFLLFERNVYRADSGQNMIRIAVGPSLLIVIYLGACSEWTVEEVAFSLVLRQGVPSPTWLPPYVTKETVLPLQKKMFIFACLLLLFIVDDV